MQIAKILSHKVFKKIALFTIMVASPIGQAKQKSIKLNSGAQQVTVIELFSSEGCSSCPPADRQLAALKNNENIFKTFVPMEFHVDYWNQLGWTDPFSNKSFSSRQRSYAREWGNGGVYTPAFVVNGNEHRLGSALPTRKRLLIVSLFG